jgi:hypothetical protein
MDRLYKFYQLNSVSVYKITSLSQIGIDIDSQSDWNSKPRP